MPFTQSKSYVAPQTHKAFDRVVTYWALECLDPLYEVFDAARDVLSLHYGSVQSQQLQNT